jgi:two-component system sensor histidine kinase CpxA
MKAGPSFPLLAKVLTWLLFHLVVITLVFLGFMRWQLGLGLDSLISGSAGERLKTFGEHARERIDHLPPAEWDAAIRSLADEKGVTAGFYLPENRRTFTSKVPPNVLEKLNESGLQLRHGPDRRPPPPPLSVEAGRPPGRGLDRQRMVPSGEFRDGGVPTEDPPMSRPIFLVRGDRGDGYWAGIQLFLPGSSGRPPRQGLLLIRSDRVDGSGMFFEIKPWFVGGLAVLLLSVAFWTPFVWQITRYLNRLTIATQQIAAGNFEISVPPRGNDELGSLGNAVNVMAVRLDHMVAGQKRFLSDAAHELCAPLARLRTGIGILEMTLDERLQPRLVQIEEEAQELATLIEEILSFSRAGSRPPELQTVNLAQLVAEVVAREAVAIGVERQIPNNLQVIADPSLIARALGNLVRNAEIHAGADHQLVIQASESADEVLLSVSDNGPGVPESELSRLFEPFYRPDRSRTRATGGSGLGLAIVRSAVTACHGEAAASLTPNGGLCITLKLKRALPGLPAA